MHFGLTYEQIDYQNQKTKDMLKDILYGAKQLTGFSSNGCKLLIEVFPAPMGGCIVYFSNTINTAQNLKRLKIKHKSFSPQVYKFENSDDLLAAMNAVHDIRDEHLQSELYLHEKKYYLVIWANDIQPISGILNEYSSVESSPLIISAMLSEHAELLAAPDALSRISKTMN